MAPGVKQQAWSFNGKVPGPALRGRVGDLFTLTLVNDTRNKLGHSIDFHASKVAWNDEMRTINPGEQLVYQFKAKHAGIFMYHCGTAPTLQTESWDAVVFNGYATQDKFRPIRVEPHQRARVGSWTSSPPRAVLSSSASTSRGCTRS